MCTEPPFFNPDADDAVNYGAMGAIVGHEMTHGFDDQGRKYNSEGNMVDWWTEEDGAEYERRVEVMVKQASEFEVHGTPLQGKLTCGAGTFCASLCQNQRCAKARDKRRLGKVEGESRLFLQARTSQTSAGCGWPTGR